MLLKETFNKTCLKSHTGSNLWLNSEGIFVQNYMLMKEVSSFSSHSQRFRVISCHVIQNYKKYFRISRSKRSQKVAGTRTVRYCAIIMSNKTTKTFRWLLSRWVTRFWSKIPYLIYRAARRSFTFTIMPMTSKLIANWHAQQGWPSCLKKGRQQSVTHWPHRITCWLSVDAPPKRAFSWEGQTRRLWAMFSS